MEINNNFYLDLDYALDSQAQADFNFVISRSGKLIELQGTAEKEPLDFNEFEKLKEIALNGVLQVFEQIDFASLEVLDANSVKVPMFSLENRLNKTL